MTGLGGKYHKSDVEGETILIKLKQNNITTKKAATTFAEGFVEDPLYCHLVPNEKVRLQVLELFFTIYLGIFGRYGDLVATSDELGAVAYIYYQDRFTNKLFYSKKLVSNMLRGLDFLKYMKIKELYRMVRSLKTFSSEWIEKYVDGHYIHLDLIVVKEAARKQGKAKQIIHYIIEEARVANVPVTLETQNPECVAMYEHFGFEVVCVIEEAGIAQYCMIKKPQ